MPDEPDDWRQLNRANWDERVAVHLDAAGYGLGPLRAGLGRLHPIEKGSCVQSRGYGCCTCNAISGATA